MHRILLVGTGNVGGRVVEILARESRPLELFIADVWMRG